MRNRKIAYDWLMRNAARPVRSPHPRRSADRPAKDTKPNRPVGSISS